jgi:uncharacterized membrane protein YsdA (DUF1294 family)
MIYYIGLVNLLGFVLMGYDKSQARKKGSRVPERRLFYIAACGGALGAWIGMKLWRHKTKHTSFVIGIPCLVVLNFSLLYYFYLRFFSF